MKSALITGIYGQCGSWLAKLLLEKGYEVYGLSKPRTSPENHIKIGIHGKVKVIDGDITDASSVANAIIKSKPDEIYSLAAQSHVGYSFQAPQVTCATNFLGHLNIIMQARIHAPKCRIYHASTSEMFGYSKGVLNEQTPFQPMSPYAISKVAAHWCGVNARYEANQFVCNGILFNNESSLRHPSFVTRKITMAVAKGLPLELGNLNSVRDWGHARDYVEGMWMMMQHDKPDDYVLATGEAHSVRDFVRMAYKAVGKEIKFSGKGIDEIGTVDGKVMVRVNPEFYRPNELGFLLGDFSKAKAILGWKPKTGIEQLVKEMIDEDRR